MKTLVVGAFGQELLSAAERLGAGGDAVSGAEERIAELMRSGSTHAEIVASLAKYDTVLICEVGSGVVPLDRFEREWREEVGRTAAELAQAAELVIRVVCGIPVALKDERKK